MCGWCGRRNWAPGQWRATLSAPGIATWRCVRHATGGSSPMAVDLSVSYRAPATARAMAEAATRFLDSLNPAQREYGNVAYSRWAGLSESRNRVAASAMARAVAGARYDTERSTAIGELPPVAWRTHRHVAMPGADSVARSGEDARQHLAHHPFELPELVPAGDAQRHLSEPKLLVGEQVA